MLCANAGKSASGTPDFDSSPLRCTSIRTVKRLVSAAAAASSFWASARLSSESTRWKNLRRARFIALHVTDHVQGRIEVNTVGRFDSHSCTRFSPKWRRPSSYAERIASGGNVLETATSVMSSAVRPARAADRAIRSRISARFEAMRVSCEAIRAILTRGQTRTWREPH